MALAGAGCSQGTLFQPPSTLAELTAEQAASNRGFPAETLVLHNTRRVLDPELAAAARLASLAVIERLDADSPIVHRRLALVLANSRDDETVRMAVLDLLVRKDYPLLAPSVALALSGASDVAFRDNLLDWLTRHPSGTMLPMVVQAWAEEEPSGPREPTYRRLVEAVARQAWPDALLAAVNDPGFAFRSAALELLPDRVTPDDLRARVRALQPRTDEAEALRFYDGRLDYLPAGRAELRAAMSTYRTQRRLVEEAAGQAEPWRQAYGYRFNVRDLHVLSRLRTDPGRRVPSRADLAAALTAEFAARAHVSRSPAGGEGGAAPATDVESQAARLSMADMVNLQLLNEMLKRPEVHSAIRQMADRDRADTTTQWGGLVFYEDGRAILRPYPAGQGGNDRAYVPSDRMAREAADSLVSFQGHFQRADNREAVGPDPDDLSAARRMNWYGLILTSLDASTIDATYYNPDGVVVSLGSYALGGS